MFHIKNHYVLQLSYPTAFNYCNVHEDCASLASYKIFLLRGVGGGDAAG